MPATRLHTALSLLVVVAAVAAFRATGTVRWSALELGLAEGLLKILLWVVPCLAAAMILDRASLHESWRALGLDDRPMRGYRFGLFATLPMAAVVAFIALGRLDSDELVGSVILGPFAEEVLFRGFLFRRLHLVAGWTPNAAIGASAVLFGLGHIGTPGTNATDIVILAAGGWMFAWICYRWNSLWPAVGLHSFINLWWVLGDPGPTMNAVATSVGHLLSVLSAVLITLWWKKTLPTGNMAHAGPSV